mmetsp:Transcript_16280/g.41747  ORF Transcript_16280/g.41747 Transcript_16280/m.41747 type:complete len:243 (+) Transcript_16280:333-1061(+)
MKSTLVVLQLAVIGTEVIAVLDEEFEILLEHRGRWQIEVGLDLGTEVLLRFELEEQRTAEVGVVHFDRNLLKDLGKVHLCLLERLGGELASGEQRHELIGQTEGLQREMAVRAQHRIEDDHHTLLQVLLVVELGLHHALVHVRTQVSTLVPAHCVVVHVHFAHAAHHLQLILSAGVFRVLIILAVWERETVCNLQTGVNVETKELASDQIRQAFLTVLDNLKHGQTFQLYGTHMRRRASTCR